LDGNPDKPIADLNIKLIVSASSFSAGQNCQHFSIGCLGHFSDRR
jgi:hypothetical protein